LAELSDEQKAELTMYIKWLVYSALTEDVNEEQLVVTGLAASNISADLSGGEMEMVPGLLRSADQSLPAQMDKTSG
jgi:hypothetical protein